MLESCPYLWRSFLFPGIFKDIGIIDHDTVIEVQRSDLVAEHIGGTNAKTEKMLKKAEGQVLIVDEAYTLSSTSGKDYGKEAVEAMMAKMNANIDGKTKNPTFIFARYPLKWKTSWEWTQVSQDEFQISSSSTIIRRWNSQK